MSETIGMVLDVPKQFYKDSVQLLNRCSKPDKKGMI
jgi:preprotein translocase subunit Sss1